MSGLSGGISGQSNNSSGNQNQTSITAPVLGPSLQNILGPTSAFGNPTVPQLLQETLSQVPSPGSIINSFPLQGTAPLTGAQTADINLLQSLSTGGGGASTGTGAFATNPNESLAADAYSFLAGGPNTAVPYGENVYANITAPTLLSEASLAGQGNSGAALESLALGGEQMALPIAQQGLQNIATGAGGLESIGSQQYSQGIQNLGTALTAAGIPQQEAQAILNALYTQGATKAGLGLNEINMLAQWLPRLLGSETASAGTFNQSGGNSLIGLGA